MTDALLAARIDRARELLSTVRHVAIATVNADGSPHNSPVFAGTDDQLNVYWLSCQDCQHTQNIDRDGRVFVVMFDSTGAGGGLYIQGTARELNGDELKAGLQVLNAARDRHEKYQPDVTFINGSEQCLYRATPEKMWINLAERDEQGRIIRDYRHEISIKDLL
jgi:putative heme iron utilization protein